MLSGSVDPDIGDDGAPQVGDDVALLVNAWWEPLDVRADLGDGRPGSSPPTATTPIGAE